MRDTGETLPVLPKGWVWTQFEIIAEINPRLHLEKYSDDMEVSFLPMKAVEELSGKVNLSIVKKLSEVKKGFTSFIDDDIIFAKITPCMENGKVAIVNKLKNGIGFGSTEFHVIRLLDKKIPKKYFFFYVIQEDFRRDAQRNMKGTAGQLRVPTDYLRQKNIPFPPLLEQNRIVTKIEALFTKLDAGVEALYTIQSQLKVYRQSVLKAAMIGKLTEPWRKEHKDELELASVLLERIKEERKKKLGNKYKELPPIDISNLPQVPERWMWARLGQITEIILGQSPPSSTYNDEFKGLPFYQGKLEFGDIYPTPKKWCNEPKKIAEKGDVLISVRAPVGPTNICPEKSCIGRGLAAIRGLSEIQSNFLLYLMRSRESILAGKGTGTTFNAITGGQLTNFEIPLAPLREQEKISEEIERRFSVIDDITKTVTQSIEQAERLRQSILKRAFEGKLVPQDPTDEPASKLLERIKAEKERMKPTGEKKPKGEVKQQRLISYVK